MIATKQHSLKKQEHIIYMHKCNYSIKRIADYYALELSEVRQILDDNGIEAKTNGCQVSQDEINEIIFQYVNEPVSLHKMAEAFDTNHMRIKRILEANDIDIKQRGKEIEEADVFEMTFLHSDQGYSYRELAKIFETNHTRVKRVVEKALKDVR